MAGTYFKSLGAPDETIHMPNVEEHVVDLNDLTVGRTVHQPGFRWSKDVQPLVGGDSCRARHVGVVLSGRLGVELDDGTKFEVGPDDVYDIPPGHDGYVVGEEPVVVLEWAGLRAFAGFRAGARGRVLLTLVFTDVVGSTALASQMGDMAWRETLSAHLEAIRGELERYGGNEVKTTGDGMLTTFQGPAQALHYADAVRRAADRTGVQVRAGVHVGEVEVVGNDVRGIAVHEAARVIGEADPGEVLVSETTRILAQAAGLTFEDRGTHELKGLDGARRLFAYVPA